MKTFHLFAPALLTTLCFNSLSFADGQRGLSQLEFDQPALLLKAPEVKRDAIREILGETEAPKQKPTKAEAASANPASARGRLADPDPTVVAKLTPKTAEDNQGTKLSAKVTSTFDWVKPQDGSAHYLVPRLKGPRTDESNALTITTKATWIKGKAGCQDVKDQGAQSKKAMALKEMLNRFSGSDDFYLAQCSQICVKPNEVPVLSAFAVKSVPEGEFKMAEIDGACHYQIVSHLQPPRWQMMEGERGSCSCLPQSALQ